MFGSTPPTPAEGRLAPLLRRPVTASMLLILIVVLGVVAYRRIPIMLLPKGISEPWMSVSVRFANSSPEEMAEKVTKPIEDAARTLPNVARVVSRSNANDARINIQFGANADMDLAYAELMDRLERVKPTLPDGADQIRVSHENSDVELPIFWLGILIDDAIEDPFATVEDILQPRIEAVDGVALVDISGMLQDTIRVYVKPELLRSFGVSLYEVVAALRRDNFQLPAGSVKDGGREFLLRIDTAYSSLEELRRFPIKDNVELGDVAEVRLARAYRDMVNRVNGKNALTCTINKESDANTVDVCARVLELLKTLETDPRLAGFSYSVYFNQAEMIVSALDNLKSSMGWGALFAVLVLYVFVRRISTTLMVAVAIPVSLLAALVVVYFSGFTFNIISLAGFTLAIGMLVDNSIVVAENIERKRAEGLAPFAAAAAGAGQVALAIVLSTLTTVVVFTPLVFMSGDRNTRIFLGELAAPITYSLLASLLVALVFLPIAAIALARRSGAGATANSFAARESATYRRLLAWTIEHRFGAVVTTALVISAGAYSAQHVEINFQDRDEGGGRVSIAVDLPRSLTLPEASDLFQRIEDHLAAKKQDYGFEDSAVRFRRNGGRVTVWLGDAFTPDQQRQFTRRLRDELPLIPGVVYQAGFEQGGEGEGSIQVRLEGPDSGDLVAIGEDLVRELERLPELTNVRLDREDGLDELRVSVDRDRAQRFGVTQEVLQGLISWGVGGQQLAPFRSGEREIPIIVEYEEPEVGDLNYLRALDVPVDGRGGSIPLAALTSFTFDKSIGEIRRENGVVSLGLMAESFDKNSYRVQRRVAEVLDRYPFPEGYRWSDRGGRQRFEESESEINHGLLVGVAFVFLLMGLLFESTILPLAVLLTIPLAMVGAYAALYLTRTPLDGTAMLALILLAGVVVNNGIVLVDRIQQLRNAGVARREAVVTGCSQRLRPVLMTALTTIFGLLPMALPEVFGSSGQSGLNYKSLAVATLGGLTLSTVLTLLVVPLFYTLFDDLSLLLRAMVGLAPPAPTTPDAALDRNVAVR